MRKIGEPRLRPVLLLLAALAVAGLARRPQSATAAEPAFEELLSYVFFEDTQAYLDPRNFVCRHIALTKADDFCNATFKVIDPNACKVEVIREYRATWTQDNKSGREFMRTKEIFTVANIDLQNVRTEPGVRPRSKRARFEGAIDIYRQEGHQYAFDLDSDGFYHACRIDGASVDISEAECVARGAKPISGSTKMSLLFSETGFDKAMSAVKRLQRDFCPAGGNKL